MPTLVITGHPSCGKSRFARVLAERALALPSTGSATPTTTISTVVLISEETACPGRTKAECYADSGAEKVTREALRSTFDRYCTSSGGGSGTGTRSGIGGTSSSGGGGTGGSGIVLHRKGADGNARHNSGNGSEGRLVILDSLNYIKGFRYEIHCIAKASGQRHGVVWVLNDPDKCLEWNDRRRRRRRQGDDDDDDDDKEMNSDGDANGNDGNSSTAAEEDWYQSDDMMRELMRRYEPPDERNRWDKPLYRADIGSILAKAEGDAPPSATTAPTTSAESSGGGATATDPNEGGSGSSRNGPSSSSSADAVLSRTLYDMHCLTEAIGGDAASTAPTRTGTAQTDTGAAAQQNTKPASKSFKRSAAAGFRRNKARSVTTAAAKGKSTLGASDGFAISKLTPEALESLDASNDNNNGGGSTTDEEGNNTKGKEVTRDSTRQPAKKVGGGNSTDKDNGTCKEPTTLEELADSILNSFLGKDVAPLKEGKSTALLVNAGANVLHDVDAITQRLITALMAEQRNAAARGGAGTSGGILRVPLGQGDAQKTLSMRTNRSISLSELKRLRREYVKWSSSHPPEDTSEVGIATSFLTFVESQL